MTGEDIIGVVEHGGKTYKIDWPLMPDEPNIREEYMDIYLDGERVGEAATPFGNLSLNVSDVMNLAQEIIESGDTEDQRNTQ